LTVVSRVGRPNRDPVDSLRTRTWFDCVQQLSGGKSVFWFRKTFGREVGSKSSWYKWKKIGAVPNDRVIEIVDNEFPGSGRIFHALFWSVLKGKQPTRADIIDELASFRSQFSALPDQTLMVEFFENYDDPKDPLEKVFRHFVGVDDCEDITFEVIILMMSWAKSDPGLTNLWNDLCELYRELLPRFMYSIELPFKDELFDAVDEFALKRVPENRISTKTVFKSWRKEIPRFELLLGQRYTQYLKNWRDRAFIDSQKLPDSKCKKVGDSIAKENCKKDAMSMDFRIFGN